MDESHIYDIKKVETASLLARCAEEERETRGNTSNESGAKLIRTFRSKIDPMRVRETSEVLTSDKVLLRSIISSRFASNSQGKETKVAKKSIDLAKNVKR